jgi:hypothetical protein
VSSIPTPAAGAAASASPTAAGRPSAPLVDPILVGAGDIARCDTRDDEATAALLDGIDGTVFTAGDNAYDAGTPAQFAECYAPTWGRHLDRTRPAPGNHDWSTDRLEGYLGYFGERAAPDGTTWYSYDLGTWHIVVLDSDCDEVGGCGPDSEQGRWLADDLASSEAACTLAVFHHPRWSSGEHGDIEAVAPFWDALHAAGADVIVNGHDHDYERFAPQDPGGREDRARGLRQFVVGTGGTPLRDFVRVAPNSELRVKLHGVLAFTLRAGSYDWAFIPTSTDLSDRGTASCH